MVGMEWGRNQLMLESSSETICTRYVTVLHELMHKVGLWHEQSRYDRDKYIKIRWENIREGTYGGIVYRNQFEKMDKRDSSIYGVPYDYRSAMHYAKNVWSKSSNMVTIETRDRKYQDVIGNVQRASKGDWRKICGIYRCGRCMGKAVRKRRKTTQGKRRKSGGSAGGRRRKTRTENISKWFSRDSPTLLMANASAQMGEELPVPTEVKNPNSSSSSSAEDNDEGNSSSNSAGDLPSENEDENGEESEEDADEIDKEEDEDMEAVDKAGDGANHKEESEGDE